MIPKISADDFNTLDRSVNSAYAENCAYAKVPLSVATRIHKEFEKQFVKNNKNENIGRKSEYPCKKCGKLEVYVKENGDDCDAFVKCYACNHSYWVDGIDF